MKEQEETFKKPSLKDEMALKILLFAKERLDSNLYWPALKSYRWLSKNNLILGSSQGEELQKPDKPVGFEKGFSQTQAKKGIKVLRKFDKSLEHRKKIANVYNKVLLELGIEPPYEPEYAEHTYLKFPLLVKNRVKFFRSAEKDKIELGDWFLSPLHPIIKNFGLWHYKWGENPIAEKISNLIVNLPNHTKIGEDYVDRIAEFLKRNRDNIFCSYEDLLQIRA